MLCFCSLFILLPLFWQNAYGAQALSFPDVFESDWFAPSVIRARDEGVLNGYPDGRFRPHNTVTYGEFLKMAVKNAPQTGQRHWAGSYYEEGLRRKLFKEGEILKGALDKPITRKYMALVFAGLLNEAGGSKITQTVEGAEGDAMSLSNFSDIASRSAFRPFIAQSAAAGILTGYPDRTFRPENTLTRAEAAAAFMRLSDVLTSAANPSGDQEPDACGFGGNKTPQADSERAPSIEDVMEPAYKAYLDSILDSLRVFGSAGNYGYRFDVPEAPGESKVYFKVAFYSSSGATVFPSEKIISKDPTKRTVSKSIYGLHALSDIGIASFNFSISSIDSQNWHDYLLRWEIGDIFTLRIQHLDAETNVVTEQYSTKALNYIFSWQ